MKSSEGTFYYVLVLYINGGSIRADLQLRISVCLGIGHFIHNPYSTNWLEVHIRVAILIRFPYTKTLCGSPQTVQRYRRDYPLPSSTKLICICTIVLSIIFVVWQTSKCHRPAGITNRFGSQMCTSRSFASLGVIKRTLLILILIYSPNIVDKLSIFNILVRSIPR